MKVEVAVTENIAPVSVTIPFCTRSDGPCHDLLTSVLLACIVRNVEISQSEKQNQV